MTLGELLAWIDKSGALVVVEGGAPLLRPAGRTVRVGGEVVEALKENRDYFLSLGQGGDEGGGLSVLDPPLTCKECGLLIHCGDAGVVFGLCGNLYCPFWQPGMGPGWFGRARSYALWKRGKVKAEAKRMEESEIPE